jgi:hypothetical protein
LCTAHCLALSQPVCAGAQIEDLSDLEIPLAVAEHETALGRVSAIVD